MFNFEKGELINMTQAWDKEKIHESNPWPPEHGASSPSTELRELVVSKLGHLAEFICDRCLAYCQDEHCQSQCKWLRRLNFKLGNEFLKRELTNMTLVWDKEKIWVHDKIFFSCSTLFYFVTLFSLVYKKNSWSTSSSHLP